MAFFDIKTVLSAVSALFLFVLPAMAADKAAPLFERAPLAIVTADGTRHVFEVELAVTNEQRQHGLMFREEMAANQGMLFDFGTTAASPCGCATPSCRSTWSSSTRAARS